MSYPIISADSHVTEPPNAYIDNIDPAYRDRAPHLEHVEGAGDMFVVEGLKVLKATAQVFGFQYETVDYPYGADNTLETMIRSMGLT